MTDRTIGVDISESHHDVFWLEGGGTKRFDTSGAGFRALIGWLGKGAMAPVVFALTGACHKAFEVALGEKLLLVKVNPFQARRFAEASGTRAKTDALDARMLAIMGAAFNLEPKAPCSKEMRVLKGFHVTLDLQ